MPKRPVVSLRPAAVYLLHSGYMEGLVGSRTPQMMKPRSLRTNERLTARLARRAHADMSTRAVYLRWCPWNEVNDGLDYVPGWPRMFPAPPHARAGPRVRTVGWILIACLSLFALICLVLMVRRRRWDDAATPTCTFTVSSSRARERTRQVGFRATLP
jgi:hypothetical protein